MVHHGQRLLLKRVRERAAARHDKKQHQTSANGAGNPHLLQPIDGWIERVEQQCSEDKWDQDGLHELKEQNDDGNRQQGERDVPELDGRGEEGSVFAIGVFGRLRTFGHARYFEPLEQFPRAR